MMNNKVQATQHETETTESAMDNGRELTAVAQGQGTANRRFGLMDLWAIRRNGRKLRIHNRIPRV